MTAVAHVARRLHAAAGAGGQLAEGHADGGYALILTVDDDEAVRDRLDAADAFEAAAGGHRVLEDGVERDVLDRAVRGFLDHLVDGLIAAGALVEAALLEDRLARALRVQLVRRLGIEPGNGAAQAETLRGDDAAVRRGEALAEDAGVEAVDGLIRHGQQAVVALVVARHGDLVAELLGSGLVRDERDLALIDDGVEFVHDHMVQDLAEVLQAQPLGEGVVRDAHADLIALAGVHDALHVVEPGVDLALDDGLEIGLHLRARDLDERAQSVVLLAAVHIVAEDGDLVVLDLGRIAHEHELGRGVLAGPVFGVHVGLADDLALKGGRKGDGDGQLLRLDLDVAQLEGVLDGQAVIQHGFQRAGDLILAEVDVDDDREAQGDGACARGDDDIVDRAERIDERRDALLRVLQQAGQVAGLDIAEDQGRADGDGDGVDDGGDVMAERHDAQLEAHLHAALGALVENAADEEGQDAL